MEKTGRPYQSFEELQSHLTACCSSIACSASATRLGLHKGLQVDSPGLTEDVRRSARAGRRAEPQVRSGEDESVAWREVLAHGAPKALGDAFLAAVAAVALGRGQFKHAVDILREHAHSCAGLQESLSANASPRTTKLRWHCHHGGAVVMWPCSDSDSDSDSSLPLYFIAGSAI